MHILITGAAGMIGRKLTARLTEDKNLNGKPIDRLTLTDVIAPDNPKNFTGDDRERRRRPGRARHGGKASGQPS